MKKSLSVMMLLYLICTTASDSRAQEYQWLKTLGTNSFVEIEDIEHNDGYIFLTGRFRGSVDFGTTILNSHSTFAATSDIFLAKYDTLGNEVWVKNFGNNQSSRSGLSVYATGKSLAFDDFGNIYLVGSYHDVTLFNSISIGLADEINMFVCKFSSSGMALWVEPIKNGGSYSTYKYPVQIQVSNSGYLYVGFTVRSHIVFYNSVALFNLGATTFPGCIFKIDTSNGNLINHRLLGMNTSASITPNPAVDVLGIEIGEGESILVMGTHKGSFYEGSIILNNNLSPRAQMFLMEMDSSFNVKWLKNSKHVSSSTSSNAPDIYPKTLALDKEKNIYVAGGYNQSFYYDNVQPSVNSGINPFLLKMDSVGNLQYIKSFKTDTTVNVATDQISMIRIGKDNSIFATGSFTKNIQINNTFLYTNGASDIFTFKLDSLTNSVWALNAGGAGDDYGRGLALDSLDNIYTVGIFKGLSNFGSQYLNATGSSQDVFISKLGDCNKNTISIAALGDTSFCEPGSVYLLTPNVSGATYQWLKNGSVVQGKTFSNYLATSSGMYSIVVNNNGCKDTSRSVQVREDPIPKNVSLSLTDSVCQNDPFLLLNGIPSGGRYIGSGVVNNEFHPSMANIGTNRISYVVDSTGCADTAFADVHVAEAPGPVISGNTHVCGNSSGHTYTLGTTSTLPTTLNWGIQGGSIVSGQGTNSITVDWGGSGQGWVSLQESNAFLCDSTYTLMVDVVGQQFQGEIYGSDTICTNTAIATHYVNNPSLFYNWTVQGGSMVSGQGTNSVHIDWHTAGTGILSVHMFNNCGKDTIFYDTVTVGAPPTPMIQGTTVACEGSQEIYLPVSTGNSYQWRTGSGGNAIGMANRDTLMVEWKNAGMEHVELIETNAFNCTDSTTMNVEVLADTHTVVNEVICYGSTYVFGGTSLSQSGTYTDTLVAANSCDSVVMLTLNLWDLDTSTVNAAICQGSTYNFGGKVYVSAGLYHDTLANLKGCDSIVSLNLSVLPNKATVINGTICDNAVYSFGSRTLSVAGTYYDTLVASNSCDSVVTLHLNILPTASTSLSASICQGGSYSFGGKSLTVSGTYHDTLFANNSCDSIVTLSLNVLPIISSTLQAEICNGDSYSFNGQTLTISGTYHDTLMGSNSCDSIVTLSLNVLPLKSGSIQVDICNGGSYNFNGQTLTSSGTYHDTLQTTLGCDSIVSLLLTELSPINTILNESICSGNAYDFNGKLLSSAGNYSDTLVSFLGCDSVIDLSLSVQAALNDSIMRKKDSLIAFEPLANYQWYSCDLQSQSYTAIAGANMRYLVPNDSNYYAVEVSLNACVDTSDCQRPLLLTGIGKEQLGSVLRVYPNPTRGVVHLEASFSKIEEINIEIRDIHGKLVYQEQQYLSTREFNHEFDLSGNAKGVYIIKISSENESTIKKIVLN